MLIECKECNLMVSDKASSCPHCGYPMKSFSKKSNRGKSRLRLPNGFGQITEIKGKSLRKPFRAMITVGKNDKGRPICKLLKPEAYFETYNDAYYALVEYNKNPYDVDQGMTLNELYDKWSEYYFSTLKSDSSIRTIKSAWSKCSKISNMRVKDIRVRHIKGCMEECESESIKNRIKSMFNLMLDYAVEYEIVAKNYARDFNIEKVEQNIIHNSFSDLELNKLWENESNPLISIILLQCYTGFRPQELCEIKLENINTDKWSIIGGMKTEAGTDRLVPLCKNIIPVTKKLITLSKSLGSDYLCCNNDGTKLTYDKYYKRFVNIMNELEMKHIPHDPRKTFITMCKNSGMDEYAIKYIVGHSVSDLTEKIYTDRNKDWLYDEIKKI